MYKQKLNVLCQKSKWPTLTYSFIKDGKDHNPLFKATVVVNDVTFASRSFFKSTKLAGNDAAEIALTHFTTSSGDASKTGEPDLNKPVDSYLVYDENGVRVHTSIPITVLPKETIVLPIGEHKWTIVSFESAQQIV